MYARMNVCGFKGIGVSRKLPALKLAQQPSEHVVANMCSSLFPAIQLALEQLTCADSACHIRALHTVHLVTVQCLDCSGGCMDSDIPEGRGVEAAVEALRATNFRLRCLELRAATLENQSSEFRELQARVNTLALRLDTAEGAIAVLQSSFVNQQGISLRSEVQSLSKVLTQAVEVLNRLEPELLRLLRWRQRFTSSLQRELDVLGHQFSIVGAQLDVVRLDELD